MPQTVTIRVYHYLRSIFTLSNDVISILVVANVCVNNLKEWMFNTPMLKKDEKQQIVKRFEAASFECDFYKIHFQLMSIGYFT